MITKANLKTLWKERKKSEPDAMVYPTENEIYFGDARIWVAPKKSNAGQMVKAMQKIEGWIKEFEYLERRTADATIISVLRGVLWLRSTERRYRMKLDKYTCQRCGIKQSQAKDNKIRLEVHHKSKKIDLPKIIRFLQEELLCDPDYLETLCAGCHLHEKEDK